jgi:hypothetical protein
MAEVDGEVRSRASGWQLVDIHSYGMFGFSVLATECSMAKEAHGGGDFDPQVDLKWWWWFL